MVKLRKLGHEDIIYDQRTHKTWMLCLEKSSVFLCICVCVCFTVSVYLCVCVSLFLCICVCMCVLMLLCIYVYVCFIFPVCLCTRCLWNKSFTLFDFLKHTLFGWGRKKFIWHPVYMCTSFEVLFTIYRRPVWNVCKKL